MFVLAAYFVIGALLAVGFLAVVVESRDLRRDFRVSSVGIATTAIFLFYPLVFVRLLWMDRTSGSKNNWEHSLKPFRWPILILTCFVVGFLIFWCWWIAGFAGAALLASFTRKSSR